MSGTTHKLTRSALNAMAAEVGTEAGPGATTKEFNRALIETSGPIAASSRANCKARTSCC